MSVEHLRSAIQDLVNAELDNALAYTNGGAPGSEKQRELEKELFDARAALSAALSSTAEPALYLCEAPRGRWSSGRIECRPEFVEDWRASGYECTPYFATPPASDLREENRWHPIETAPKDNSPLLLCCADWSHSRLLGKQAPIKVGGWDVENARWHIFGASWSPSHWMPLPSPPTVDTARWVCARCGQSFDHAAEAPHALEVTFRKLNRLVCQQCFFAQDSNAEDGK